MTYIDNIKEVTYIMNISYRNYNGAWILSTVTGDYGREVYYARQYQGYTKAQAVKLFKAYVKQSGLV